MVAGMFKDLIGGNSPSLSVKEGLITRLTSTLPDLALDFLGPGVW